MGTQIEILKDGPILVHGDIQLTHYDGKQEFQKNTTAFCRCGVSKNKPFCDGSHVKQGFKD
ncbi:MAG: CDGSH iron-sulfur domain-containing protein [Bacteroidota bacterium]